MILVTDPINYVTYQQSKCFVLLMYEFDTSSLRLRGEVEEKSKTNEVSS